jgi:hypothetical protein
VALGLIVLVQGVTCAIYWRNAGMCMEEGSGMGDSDESASIMDEEAR